MKEKIEIHLHTNDSCNLKCVHCYNKSGEKAADNMPEIDLLMELIQYFCENYKAEIHLEGGEIFLRPELLRGLGTLSTEILQCITITTNGTIFTAEPKIVEMLCKIHAFRISVEGHTDKQQRMIRGITLNKVIEHALLYKERSVHVWLRLTMTSRNCEHLLDETLPYYVNMGFRNFQVYEFQAVGRGRTSRNLLAVSDKSFVSFLENLEKWEELPEKEDMHMGFMFSRIRRTLIFSHRKQLELNGLKVFNIPAENGLNIHADGSVYLCAWDNDKEHCILNVYREGMMQMESKLKQMDLKHTCSHCSAVRITN